MPFLNKSAKPKKSAKAKSGEFSLRDQLSALLSDLGYHVGGASDRSGLHFVVQALLKKSSWDVVEVGASDGSLTSLILDSGEGSVLALEANSQFRDVLDSLKNKYPDRLSLLEAAAGEKDGFTNLRYNPSTPSSATTSTSDQINEATTTNALSKRVVRTTIDQALSDSSLSTAMVVIDAPGSADKIIRGMSGTLANPGLSIVIASIVPLPGRSDTSLSSIASLFGGWDLFRILPGKGGVERLSRRDPYFDLPFDSYVLFARSSASSLLHEKLKVAEANSQELSD